MHTNKNLVENQVVSSQNSIERSFAEEIGEFLRLVNYPIDKELGEVELLVRTLNTRKRDEKGRKGNYHGTNYTIWFQGDYTPTRETVKTLKRLQAVNKAGYCVFYIVNGQGTKKEQISHLNSLYVDIDKDAEGNPIPKEKQMEIVLDKMGGLEPTVTVDTGGKSLHFYYTFEQPVPKEQGLLLLKDLVDYIGVADKSCKDESRIFRLPGFLYQKTGQENPSKSKIYSQTGNRYSFDQLRKIIPISVEETKNNRKVKIKDSKGKASKPLKTAQIEGLSLEDKAKKVLCGKALNYWLESPNCQENQDTKLWTVIKELAAGARKGYFDETVGKDLARRMMLNFPTLREDSPWEERTLIEKWNRAIKDESIEYNNESNVLGEIDFGKLDEEFANLAPGDKNRMILALLKGGHNLADADELMSTPIKKNMISGNIEYLGQPMEISHILTEFENKFNLTTSQAKFTRIIETEANRNIYNPVEERLFSCFIRSKSEEYFINLESKNDYRWEKIKRYYNSAIANYQLENKAPNATFKDVFSPIKDEIKNIEEFVCGALRTYDDWDVDFVKKFLISAVARAIEPGCKVDNMLIIRSTRQGLYKSTFFEELAFFGKYYTVKTGNDVTTKDAIEGLSRGWINEIDEIERVTCTRDSHDTKSFLSKKHDTYRAAYERISLTRNRHWVLAGTSNDDTLFLDSENRRYNVVSIDEPINIPFVRKNLECLWALAVEAYLNGEKWFYETNSEGAEVTRERNKQYMYQDARSELVIEQLGVNVRYVDDVIIAKLLEGYDINHRINCMPDKRTLQEAKRMLKKFDWQKADKQKVKLHDGRRSTKAYLNPNYLDYKERAK